MSANHPFTQALRVSVIFVLITGVIFSTFSGGNLTSARAQEEATTTPPPEVTETELPPAEDTLTSQPSSSAHNPYQTLYTQMRQRPAFDPTTFGQNNIVAAVALGEPGLSYRYVRTFGVNGEPYLADGSHINQPNGLFIDSGNNLYVAEEVGNRIMKFNLASPANATLIIGHAGLPWHHDDYVSFPRDVAVRDSDGHIWIVANPMVKEFDASGNVVQTIPATNPWESGSDNEHFNDPYGIAFGPDGYLFVSDQWNHRIQIYDVSGETPAYLATIGTTGIPQADDSGFNGPMQIAFDSSNQLYVLDNQNHRVQRCTSSSPWTTWSCSTFFGDTGVEGNDLSHISWAVGIGIDSSDNIFIADGLNFRVLKCNTLGFCSLFAGETGVPGSNNSHFKFIDDVEVDSSGNVYVSDTTNFRVQKFNSLGIYKSTIGKVGVPYLTDQTRLNAPWGIAVAPDGSIYTLEHRGLRLIKMNSAGVRQWVVGQAGVSGSNNAHFGAWLWDGPEGNPAIDASGRIYVPDTNNNRVQIFTADGSYYATLGEGWWGSGNYEFAVPNGVAISPVNGDIYVADMGNHRIQVFTSARVYKATLGETGVEGDDDSHFRWPRGVTVANNGDIFVADSDNHRVQKCNFTSGINYTCTTFAGETGIAPDGSYNYIHPLSVTVDINNRVFVADEWNGRVVVYDSAGAFLTSIGDYSFSGPAGVAVDNNGNVYVGDRDNHRIQKFAPGVPGWEQVNINGFGNRYLPHTTSAEVFNDYLYIGTSDYDNGIFHIWRTGDGYAWEEIDFDFQGGISTLKAFDNKLYAATWVGGIWSSSDGLNWTNVYTGSKGFANFSVYGDALYAGTYTDSAVEGTTILKTTDGENWSTFVTNGNGDPNAAGALASTIFNGSLYFGVADWSGTQGGRIWRYDGTALVAVVNDGFGNPENFTPGGIASFNGKIYVSVANPNSFQVWASNSGDAGAWNKVFEGMQGASGAKDRTGLIVLYNQLYLVAQNDQTGMQVWRTANGTTWELIGDAGFGDSNNGWTEWSSGLEVFNNELYISTHNYANGGEIWKYLRPVVANINTLTDTGDGSLSEGEQVIVPVTKLTVTFNKDVNPPVKSNFTLKKGTTLITINSVSYDSLTRTVTLNLNDGRKLPFGKYTLTIKKNTSDIDGNSMGTNFVRKFALVKPPNVPLLISPINNALVTIPQPKLDWSNSTVPAGTTFDHYQVQLAIDMAFTAPLDENTSISEFTPAAPLTPDTKYYWRVRAYNTLGQASAWSAVGTFRQAMLPPDLISPANGDPVGTRKPTFDWTDVANNTGYIIQVATSQSFSTLLINTSVGTNVSTYTPTTNLPASKTLYWRVRAKGPNGPSAWSDVFSFTTP